MKLLWIDTETTGLYPKTNGIIQVAFIIDFQGEIVAEKQFVMNPVGRRIDDQALLINGKTREEISQFPDWQLVREEITDFLIPHGLMVRAGHNVDFDYRMLNGMWSELSSDDYGVFPFVEKGHYVDTCLMSRNRNLPIANNRLTTVCQHFGIAADGAHDALNDIRMTRKLYYKMIDHVM